MLALFAWLLNHAGLAVKVAVKVAPRSASVTQRDTHLLLNPHPSPASSLVPILLGKHAPFSCTSTLYPNYD